MKITMSDLARKVFEQTDLEINYNNAWWVEQKLQFMRINGLVKMINTSKKLELSYIDGYLPKYKWSFRKSVLDISSSEWVYGMIQGADDFNWGYWSNLVLVEYYHILAEAIGIAKAVGIFNIPYIFAIYNDKLRDLLVRKEFFTMDLVNEVKNMSDITIEEWEQIKDNL